MRIMGLDLSMSATGVCFPDGSTAVIKPRGEGDARLLSIENQAGAALRLARPDLVVVEDIQGELKGASAKVIPMVHAVVRLLLLRGGIPYAKINPTTLKRYATGSHNADKAAMTLAAFKRAGLEFKDNNQCDAWWIFAAGHAAYGAPVVELPKAHTDALRVVAWPGLAGAAVPLTPLPKQPRRRGKVAA